MEMPDTCTNPKPAVLFHQTARGPSLESKVRRGKTFKNAFPKGESKKTLVRNTELPVYSTIYKSDAPVEDKKKTNKVLSFQPPSSILYKTNLSAPCLNSVLRLAKEMKQASKAKPSDSHSAKLVDEGKILQQVNFLYEERLYHDLIALNVTDNDIIKASSSRTTSKFRVRDKDKEPQLSQFFTPSFSEEFQIPSQPFQRINRHQNVCRSVSVYQRMKSWDVMD